MVSELQYGRWGYRWFGGALHSFSTKEAAEEALRTFPRPTWNPDREPCGECRLSITETCDICGATVKGIRK